MRNLVGNFQSSTDKLLFFKSLDVKDQAKLINVVSRYYKKKLLSNLDDNNLISIFHTLTMMR